MSGKEGDSNPQAEDRPASPPSRDPLEIINMTLTLPTPAFRGPRAKCKLQGLAPWH